MPRTNDSDRNYNELRDLIEKECSKTSFACGGTITISNRSNVSDKAQAQSSNPVNLFWVSSKDDEVRKVTLPEGGPSTNVSSVEKLAGDCTLASFGRGSEDVIDVDYRHAGKLDTTQFASTFHPADFGLIENIEQILVPAIDGSKETTYLKKLVPDLYKLNIYSGPSGIFQKHVDTPRDTNQIGSLVVCLPSEFEGGTLFVRHRGKEVNFDWSSASKSTIQWAAFYSDCEHEIKTVTKGHRITLTYNLYLVDVKGGAIRLPKRIVSPESLPLYEIIKSLLEQQDFMADGGTLGIYCSHAYAHTSDNAAFRLPRNLKGSDLVIYSILQHLGYKAEIRPVLDGTLGDFEYDDDYDEDLDESEEERLKKKTKKELYKSEQERRAMNLVGNKLHPEIEDNDLRVESFEEKEMIARSWKHDCLSILWLTSPKHRESALTYIAYGNESSLGCKYSFAAILVKIPEWGKGKRKQSKTPNVK